MNKIYKVIFMEILPTYVKSSFFLVWSNMDPKTKNNIVIEIITLVVRIRNLFHSTTYIKSNGVKVQLVAKPVVAQWLYTVCMQKILSYQRLTEKKNFNWR